MKTKCPTCLAHPKKSKIRTVVSSGRFYRRSDGRWVRRFWCKSCAKSFSSATANSCFRQKKRHKNDPIRKLLAGGVSQREAARILNLNRKTVVRKFVFLATKERKRFDRENKLHPKAVEVEFDDLETFEHSKCKPLSVTLMVEAKTRRILDFEVSQMPAKGRLAKQAIKRYGYRKDFRKVGRNNLFSRAQLLVSPNATLRSDSNPYYGPTVRKYFPQAKYETILGARGAVTGQGELKKIGFDPIFSLNHSCAMLRANINRLFRRTWCTTKKRERLAGHIAIYVAQHNGRLSTAKGASFRSLCPGRGPHPQNPPPEKSP